MKMTKSSRRCPDLVCRPGMTLVEIVIAIGIVTVLMGVAHLSFRQNMVNHDLRCAAERLVCDFRLVRDVAIQQQQNKTIRLNTVNRSYRALNVPAVDGRKVIQVDLQEEWGIERLLNSDNVLTLEIVYDSRGNPSFTGNILLIKGKQNVTISIDQFGRLDWSQ